MVLTVEPFPGVLDGLGHELSQALSSLEDTRELVERDEDVALTVVGPFPTYAVDPRGFAAGGPLVGPRTGWRALLQEGEDPRAVVDITFSSGGEARFGYRGLEPAKAFASALSVAAAFADDDRGYDVRWLSLPGIYVTAVWLEGDASIIVPTRAGGTDRVLPETMTSAQLRDLVAQLLEEARARPEGGGDALIAQGPKSGFEE